MSGVRGTLAAVAAVTRVVPGGIRWFGVAEPAGPDRDGLVGVLRERLYADWYRRGGPAPAVFDDDPAPVPGRSGLAARIDAVRGTGDARQAGWRPSGAGRVARDGLAVSVTEADLGGTARAPELRLPGSLPGLAPGYHLILGRIDLDGRIGTTAMRAYLHATPRGAPALAGTLGAELDRLGLPFRMKLLADPSAYRRCDAAVLYARMEDTPAVVGAVRRLLPALAPHLRPQVPPLTLRLAPGVGWAEDPGDLDSFGHHRCGLLADGLVRAAESRETGLRDRVRRMERALADAGIDPARPHLGPGTARAPEPFA